MTRRLRFGLEALTFSISAVLLMVILLAQTQPANSFGGQQASRSADATGPLAWLLHSSVDLGPAHNQRVSTVVALRARTRPTQLLAWAARAGLQVSWQPGADWSEVSGTVRSIAAAFGVSVHDYRGRQGQVFYASAQQVNVPGGIRSDVVQVGRILSFVPHRSATRALAGPRLSLAKTGLNPSQLLTAYSASSIVAQGYTGKGSTVVFFEWASANQSDLDSFSKAAGLPQFSPILVGGPFDDSSAAGDETLLDLEVVHAIVPDARLVLVNAYTTLQHQTGGAVGVAIGKMFQATDQQFPGAVWSLSIDWGCDRMYTAADVLPVEAALEQAEAHGTTAFDASGDTGGLECKGGHDYSTPPSQSDVGVDAVGALPAMTSVGGTRLSTDASGRWAGEQVWDQSALSQGTGGGVSHYLARPSWQQAQGIQYTRDNTHRLVPDISADADPETGVMTVQGGRAGPGGGTSQAAPIWAGLTTVMDEYLLSHGGHLIGAINPLLYQIARGASLPAFHDVTLGGNAVDLAAPGYDLVTGLGTPIVSNLVADLLVTETGKS